MAGEKKSEILSNLNLLRLLVGYLGEKKQHNWWDTNFLSKTGLQFLEINFPRTAFAAGCNSVTEAARRVHDERIGKGGVFHLFRFPNDMEEDLHRLMFSEDNSDRMALIESGETALDALKSMVTNSVGAPEGPVQVGDSKNMLQDTAIQELAVHYYEAFQNQKMCFPYFKAN
ncbi:hypothetical protein Dvar_23510 [Desulfosarcina variabilis str. Montpellier]|jgi:hypothetical protein|uniref:BrxE family protein n=1 Tax=Desulfosarcina variabilis TaxID=2300 RepID=UPI003AFAE753